jgi:hypothetical protein
VKKFLGLTLLGAGIFAAVTARRKMAHRRSAEEERFRQDLERFEGEGGAPATL